jgi:hypothetical protein
MATHFGQSDGQSDPNGAGPNKARFVMSIIATKARGIVKAGLASEKRNEILRPFYHDQGGMSRHSFAWVVPGRADAARRRG